MKIGALAEVFPGETRVAMTPESAVQLQKLGHGCCIQSGAGAKSGFSNAAYEAAGVEVLADAAAVVAAADVLVKVRGPEPGEAQALRQGQTLISFFWPAQNPELLETVKERGATAIAMDMVPRISRAQKMDALSSMANLAGYRAVIEAANNFPRFLTGQVTAAGKVPPAQVLVIGAGVAGLAAIGTAVSLGAVVHAFDVRPEVAEQIESMGASFVFLEFEPAQDGAATGGYAAPSSPEFREKQLAKFRELAPQMDIVITTALIPGRPAPKLWLAEMVAAMKPGSVVVDLAAERGGNCDLTVPDQKITTDNGVTVVGYTDFPGRMAAQASTLYSNNIRHMVSDLTPNKDGVILQNMEDDVIRGSTVAHQGAVTWPPPPPRIAAIAAAKPKPKAEVAPPPDPVEVERKKGRQQILLLVVGAVVLGLLGLVVPGTFMQQMIVFVLAVFIGFTVIWNVSHALHTPLMAITNAISSIVIVGAVLQTGSLSLIVTLLAAACVFMTGINIVGGFAVTRRMLMMFKRS